MEKERTCHLRAFLSLGGWSLGILIGLTGCQTAEVPSIEGVYTSTAPSIAEGTLLETYSRQWDRQGSAPSVAEPVEGTTIDGEVVGLPFDESAHLWVIDTGNSDSLLLENDGHYALIDAGDTDDDRKVADFLKAQGVETLDYIVVTHYHADHFGAMDTILREFEVLTTFAPNGEAETQVYREFILALSEAGGSVSVPLEGVEIPFGKGSLIFYNTRGGHADENANSLVMLYQNGADLALFMGDAEENVEQTLTLSPVNWLKVGHHGSSTSSSDAFIRQIQPQAVVLTVGVGNPYGHPHEEPLALFESLKIPVYRTDETGTLSFVSTGQGIQALSEAGTYRSGAELLQGTLTPLEQDTDETAKALKVYANCKQLKVDYPNGINQWDHPTLYALNQARDGDKDGVACE